LVRGDEDVALVFRELAVRIVSVSGVEAVRDGLLLALDEESAVGMELRALARRRALAWIRDLFRTARKKRARLSNLWQVIVRTRDVGAGAPVPAVPHP